MLGLLGLVLLGGSLLVADRLGRRFVQPIRALAASAVRLGENDLSTPVPQTGFPGLKPGDRWCLCAARWKEALDAGAAPPVVLASTHALALEYISLDELE